jgi:16S rRNA (guanine1207-N2)-methyltransferase
MKEHYFSEKPESELKLTKISARLRGSEIELWTGAGVFSGKKVDKGTELLANDCIIKENWRILDLGCGYGAVGISIAKAYPSSEVVMTDINNRAVKLARMNKKLHNLKNASVVQGDMYKNVPGKFDAILLNPPQAAGKETCFKMIGESKGFMKKDGVLQVVARHNKGGKTLAEKMKSVFGNMEEVSIKSGYRIYLSRN